MDIVAALFIYTLIFMFFVISYFILRKLPSNNAKIPKSAFGFIRYVIPSTIYNFIGDALESCLYTRNPILQTVYISLLVVGYLTYFMTSYQYVSESIYGNLPFMLLSINLVLFYVCCTTDPGVITKDNVNTYLFSYPCEGKSFEECTTCLNHKPARSKHCAICDVCIARFDHHCGWVNNCIGQHNYKFFLLFIVSLVIITFISGGLTLMVFINIVHQRRLHTSVYVDLEGNRYQADFSTVVTFLLAEYPAMSFLLLYISLLFLALLCFLAFHMFLVLSNRTTNEICKSRRKVTNNERESDDSPHNRREKKSRLSKSSKRRGQGRNNTDNLTTNISDRNEINSRGGYFFTKYSKGLFGNVIEVVLG